RGDRLREAPRIALDDHRDADRARLGRGQRRTLAATVGEDDRRLDVEVGGGEPAGDLEARDEPRQAERDAELVSETGEPGALRPVAEDAELCLGAGPPRARARLEQGGVPLDRDEAADRQQRWRAETQALPERGVGAAAPGGK